MLRNVITSAVLLALLATGGMVAAAEQTADREKIIDVDRLREALDGATEPISKRMQSTTIEEKFDRVNALLEQENTDKRELLQALEELKAEIDQFTGDWQEVMRPLWDGQDAIAETADRVRLLLARGGSGRPTEEVKAIMDGYDQRLTSLAKAIKAEQDQKRRAWLKRVFANVLSLRKLMERGLGPDLTPARKALYVKTIKAMANLEAALTQATFEVEKARVVLVTQSDFIGQYIDVMSGLIEAEDLAKMLGELEETGQGVTGLSLDVQGLVRKSQEFAERMDGFAGKLVESIESETAKVTDQMETPELQGVDLEDEIERYAGEKEGSNQ